ncbi:MAG: outer membrane beta-barrel protein, partial [Acidiphilium sp.]
MIGVYYSYTKGAVTLVPEVQYVYAKVDHQIGIDKFTSNFGAELIGDYQFAKTPWSVGGQVVYYSNNGPQAWYLNAHSAGIGIGVTPTWQQGNIFARGEVGLLHLTSVGTGPAFGSSGTDRNQVIGLLEAGVVF